MPKNAKDKIIDREKIKQKRQKQIKKERQRIARALGKLRAANKRAMEVYDSIGKDKNPLVIGEGKLGEAIFGNPLSWNDFLRKTRIAAKILNRGESFWAKNRLYINAHLCRCQHLFQPQEEENEEDTALWFNFEDIKNANDLRQCWNFIREWKTYFSNYKKLKWSEKTGRKAISEKMWNEIRDYYYKRLKRNKKDKAKRYEIYETITEKFNKKYELLLPGKRPPVPQEDAFWRKFYSIKDEHSKKPTAIKIK
ncbi:hypothetical protein ES705_22605 [subsurface metagenome]